MSTTTVVERCRPVMSEVEHTTLLGFLAGYRGYTRDAYTLDLRQFTSWCWRRQHRLFEVRRVDIECFARELEDRGKARATVARRLCTIVGFFRYAEEEGGHRAFAGGPHPPTPYRLRVPRRPPRPERVGFDSRHPGLSSPRDHALVSLLALKWVAGV
jgi:integrase/recombinase XerD